MSGNAFQPRGPPSHMPARQAVPSAVPDADFLAKQGTSANSHLMPTGAAPFVWDQATRTDLWLDIILSVCVFDLLGTEGTTRALELRCRAVGEHADRGAHLACRAAFAEGLDELATGPPDRRARWAHASDVPSCLYGSEHPFDEGCNAVASTTERRPGSAIPRPSP